MEKSENSHDKPANVREMFSRISPCYDLMNRLMTFGMDLYWRRFLVEKARIPENGRVLDVGTGTGDIVLEIFKHSPETRITGVDFTHGMIETGRKKAGIRKAEWCQADAMNLPFIGATFDAVTSGFLMRNVTDVLSAFREQVRVVKPGGSIVCLDTSPVPPGLWRPFSLFYLKKVIPLLGAVITGEKQDYSYLPDSTLHFFEPEALAIIMGKAGIEKVGFKRFMFGNIAVHWGIKPLLKPKGY